MRRFRIIAIALGLLTLQGCTAIALTAGSVAAGTGINHALGGITYKTFTIPVSQLKMAALRTLHRMDIKVTETRKLDSGWQIIAQAHKRTIEIELEALTRRATRMRVVANTGGFLFRDSATATEIIIQTAQTLDMETAASNDGGMKIEEVNKNKG